ncbi:MAG: hypothetical protein RJA36_814 [Pseudomonadota bacterium]|jgi:hypothetical protein
MAAISSTRKNLVEWSQHFHRGKVLPEIAMLAQENQAVMDIPWVQCNDGTTHIFSVQTALPTVSKTMYGEGTPESKSQKAQLRETATMLTGFSTVDADQAEIGGAEGQLRAMEDANFAEALKQAWAQMMFYGNRGTNVRDVYGFQQLFNSTSGVKAKNVISCGGATANAQTSAYLVNWGPDVYGIFPEGTTAGYVKEDLGKQVKTLANGNQQVVLQTKHKWNVGLVVEAWPSVVRICNIDVAHAKALSNNQTASSALNILHQIILARLRIRRPGKKVLYVGDTVYALIMRLGLAMSGGVFSIVKAATQFGSFEQLQMYDIPIRRVDQILETEAVV